MLLGLLYEGSLDEESVRTLVHRILTHDDCVTVGVEYKKYAADGPILGKIPAAMKTFFASPELAAAAIFFTDTDDDANKESLLLQRVSAQIEHYPHAVVIPALPHRSFEQWFFSEEVALKTFYGLEATQPVPYENSLPKSRLKLIHDESAVESTLTKAYSALTTQMDLRLLADKDRSFANFYRRIRQQFGCSTF